MRRRGGHLVSRLDFSAQHVPCSVELMTLLPHSLDTGPARCRRLATSRWWKSRVAGWAETSSCPPGRRYPCPGLRLAVSSDPVLTAAVLTARSGHTGTPRLGDQVEIGNQTKLARAGAWPASGVSFPASSSAAPGHTVTPRARASASPSCSGQ